MFYALRFEPQIAPEVIKRATATEQHELKPYECNWVKYWRMYPPDQAQRESWRLNESD